MSNFQAYSREQQQRSYSQPQQQSILRPPATQFQTFEEIEFCRPDPASSFRVTVNTVEGEPYACIAHWWFNRSQGAWYPSRKQIYLPKAAWFGLLEASARISEVIEPLQGLEGQSGSSRIRLFFNLTSFYILL